MRLRIRSRTRSATTSSTGSDCARRAKSHDCAAAHGVDHLVALVRPDNAPSQRVARRLGMEVERTAHVHGGDALVFGMHRLGRP